MHHKIESYLEEVNSLSLTSSDLKYVIPIMMNAVASNFETMKTQRFSQDAFDNIKD